MTTPSLPLMKSQPIRQRSKRLRKKLHTDEFASYGFRLAISPREGLTDEEKDALADGFILEAGEANGFSCMGVLNEREWVFYPVPQGYGRDDEGRAKMLGWVAANDKIEKHEVSEWFDAWYGD